MSCLVSRHGIGNYDMWEPSTVSIGVWGCVQCATLRPHFPARLCPCKPLVSLPIFPCVIEQWEQKHLSEKVCFRRVYKRQVHPSTVCYLLPRHFFLLCFDYLFWRAVSVCARFSVALCKPWCVCVYTCMCQIEEKSDYSIINHFSLRNYIMLDPQMLALTPKASYLTKARKLSSWDHAVVYSCNPKPFHH